MLDNEEEFSGILRCNFSIVVSAVTRKRNIILARKIEKKEERMVATEES
jgi:hypothetical protein